MTEGSLGIQFTLHSPEWIGLTASEVVAASDHAADVGLDSVWINDNFEALGTYALLANIAGRRDFDLGTLVTHPFARNPMDMAANLWTIAGLLRGRKLYVGVSTGAHVFQGRFIERPQPTETLAETVDFLRRSLRGERLEFDDYPLLSEYYHLRAGGHFELPVDGGSSEVSICVPPKGPKVLAIATDVADGMIVDNYWRLGGIEHFRDGTLAHVLGAAAGPAGPMRKVLKIGVSLADDAAQARSYARNYVSSLVAMQPEDCIALGAPPEAVALVRDAYREGKPMAEVAKLVSTETVDAIVMSGTVDDVKDRVAEYVEHARSLGFDKVVLGAPVGPAPHRVIELAGALAKTL